MIPPEIFDSLHITDMFDLLLPNLHRGQAGIRSAMPRLAFFTIGFLQPKTPHVLQGMLDIVEVRVLQDTDQTATSCGGSGKGSLTGISGFGVPSNSGGRHSDRGIAIGSSDHNYGERTNGLGNRTGGKGAGG